MKKALIILGVIIVVAIVAIAVSSNGRPANEVTIGAVLPISGWGAYWAEPVQKGMNLAVEDIQKAYGANSIKIIAEDDQSAPKGAVSAATKLLSVDKVDAIYTEFSSLGTAVSPIVLANNKILMYSAMTPKILETNPLSVKTFVNIEDACNTYANYAITHGVKKIAVFNKLADVAPACMKSLLKQYSPDKILLNDNIVGNDFRTLLLKTKTFGADSIVHIMVEADSVAFIKQSSDMGINIPLFCHKGDCMTDKILSAYSKSLEGSIYFDSPISESFAKRYVERYGDIDPGLMEAAAFSYENMTNLFLAERACNKDAVCVAKYFENTVSSADPALVGMKFVNRMSSLTQKFYKIVNGKAVELEK